MLITRQQALELDSHTEIHADGCKVVIGPRGGKRTHIERYRLASQVKTWKTRPLAFRFTVKWGMSPYTYTVDEINASYFHLASECEPEIIETGES